MNPVIQVGLWMIPLEIISSGIVAELARRSRLVHCIVMFVIPSCLAPYWWFYTIDEGDQFIVAKVYSVTCLGGISIYLHRWVLNVDLKKKWTEERFHWWRRIEAVFAYISLFMNISEAVIRDLVQHRYVNAVAGIFLLLGQTFDDDMLQPASEGPTYDALWDLTGTNDPNDTRYDHVYPIAYTLWNHAFCYGSYHHLGVCHLASPCLLSWWNGWNMFMMYRAYALSFSLQIMLSHKNGSSWFFWDKQTYYNLYYNHTYYSYLQWASLAYVIFGLLLRQLQLYRQDTEKGHEKRIMSPFQWLLRAFRVPRKSKKD